MAVHPCPVGYCEAVILGTAWACHECRMNLPAWARDDIDRLHNSEQGSALYRQTIAAAITYLDDLADREGRAIS